MTTNEEQKGRVDDQFSGRNGRENSTWGHQSHTKQASDYQWEGNNKGGAGKKRETNKAKQKR